MRPFSGLPTRHRASLAKAECTTIITWPLDCYIKARYFFRLYPSRSLILATVVYGCLR